MTQEVKHTQGEWLVAETTVYCLEHAGWRKGVEQFRNRFYAGVYGHRDTPKEETEANIRLIAAAPELLEALEAASDWIDAQLGEPRLEIQAKVQAAIAKTKAAA